jgi:hypothetical protein
MKTRLIGVAGLILLLQASLAGCSSYAVAAPPDSRAGSSSASPTSSPTAGALPVLPEVQPPVGEAPTETIQLARQDLAHKLGVPPEGISITSIIGEQFTADAFYCRTTKDRIAREDPPAFISGFTILLSVSGQRYEYHASGQTVVFCRRLS